MKLILSCSNPDTIVVETYPWGREVSRGWFDQYGYTERHMKYEFFESYRDDISEVIIERHPAICGVRTWRMKPRPEEIPW